MPRLCDVMPEPGVMPGPGQVAAPDFLFTGRKPAVKRSPDFDRIKALPRRPRILPGTERAEALIDHVTAKFAKPSVGCRCQKICEEAGVIPKPCITRLNYAQAWMLHEVALHQGVAAHAATGIGKTLVDVLAPLAMPNCRTALLLISPTLARQLSVEWELLDQHFRVPSILIHHPVGKQVEWRRTVPDSTVVLHVLPYTKLSGHKNTVYLEKVLQPDAIFADECQNLSSMASVRTNRLLRYYLTLERAKKPLPRFCCWSGTLTDDEIQDYAHLLTMALRRGSPLPNNPRVVDEWGGALNPEEWLGPPGVLMEFCEPGEHVYDGFHRRLVETPGFVATSGASIDAEMEISERPAPPIPNVQHQDARSPGVPGLSKLGWWPGVEDCLDYLRETWIRPDGEWLLDALSMARCARELACGLFLRWKFVHGESRSLIDEWKAKRKAWRFELREQLRLRLPHMDSPMLCANAAMRAWGHEPRRGAVDLDEDGDDVPEASDEERETLPSWRAESWPDWHEIKDQVRPVTEPVRLDDYLAQDAAKWGLSNRGIVWYHTVAFGRWVAEISGLPQHEGGPDAGERIAKERGERSIIASIKSHGTGRDGLQRLFCTQLVAQPPASGVAWEQLLGRLSRIGQPSQLVTAFTYLHTPELASHVEAALRKALYAQRTMGSPQKLRTGWKVT